MSTEQQGPFQFVVQVHGAEDEAEATRWLTFKLRSDAVLPAFRAVVIGTALSRDGVEEW